ncbi:MAG: creatininase family protein [Chloroflexi bacterium]|nr:creatininase family protein [Chloroflexota bacterium]
MGLWHLDLVSRERVRHLAPVASLVVPVAAIEQHGPDLPVGTDLLLCRAIAERGSELAVQEASIDIVLAPPVAYGYSPHHLPYPGVFTVRSETLLAVLRELGASAYGSGFRRIFFLNGHGGNEEIIRLAARDIASERRILAGAASYWTLAWTSLDKAGLSQRLRIPGHAGDFECSLLLALGVEWDRGEHQAASKGADSLVDPAAAGSAYAVQRYRGMEAIEGYTDRSVAASAQLGEQLLAAIVPGVAKALSQFAREEVVEPYSHMP